MKGRNILFHIMKAESEKNEDRWNRLCEDKKFGKVRPDPAVLRLSITPALLVRTHPGRTTDLRSTLVFDESQ